MIDVHLQQTGYAGEVGGASGLLPGQLHVVHSQAAAPYSGKLASQQLPGGETGTINTLTVSHLQYATPALSGECVRACVPDSTQRAHPGAASHCLIRRRRPAARPVTAPGAEF